MQDLDFAALLYLLKNWDGQGPLPEYMHKFQETKKELEAALLAEKQERMDRQFQDGSYQM